MTYPEAVDEALCFGWIDGVRHALDENSFLVRFTPRRPKSLWSAVNVERASALQAEGRMRPSGLAAFRARAEREPGGPSALDAASLRRLRASARAWRFFQAQAPWYRRLSAFWVSSARRAETRAKRLEVLIASCERAKLIPPLARARKRTAQKPRNG